MDAALVAALDAALPRLQRALRQALNQAEGDDRLTMSQLHCLRAMAGSPEPAMTTRLARQLQVTAPTMTKTIDVLVERGLVERRPDPANRRTIGLVLTPAGRELLGRYERVIDDRLRALLVHLSPRQKERLLAAVGDLAVMLDADERSAQGDL